MGDGCRHPSIQKVERELVCRRCGEVVTWPPELAYVLGRLPELSPDDLPEAPWVLHSKPPRKIGKTHVQGGPYARVTGNAVWLATIKREVAQGASGPRHKTGALQHDLLGLSRVLRELSPQESYW